MYNFIFNIWFFTYLYLSEPHLSMAMFPQFFTHPSLYPHFFRASSGATAAIPNLSLSSQLAILSGSTFPPNGFNSSHAAAALQFANSHTSQFFVDNLLRDRMAAAAAAVAAANNSPSSENNAGGDGVAADQAATGGQPNRDHNNSYSSNTPEPNGAHSPCEHFGNQCHSSSKQHLNCCSSEQCSRQQQPHNHHSGRSSANASEDATTDHETESQCCDRHSDSSSPVLSSRCSPPKATVAQQLKFGMSAILSDSKSSKVALKSEYSFLCHWPVKWDWSISNISANSRWWSVLFVLFANHVGRKLAARQMAVGYNLQPTVCLMGHSN